MIRYKVVRLINKKMRTSSYAAGKFCKEYKKGSIVKAVKGTDGIYVFDVKGNANKFAHKHNALFVIRVRTIGRGKRVKQVSSSQSEYRIARFWRGIKGFPEFTPPQGTLAYKAVEVLE